VGSLLVQSKTVIARSIVVQRRKRRRRRRRRRAYRRPRTHQVEDADDRDKQMAAAGFEHFTDLFNNQ
jgi:hypothetical protein